LVPARRIEKGQSSDGTGAGGNLPKFNVDGSLTDSGLAAASFADNETPSGGQIGACERAAQ
jgi:hypothetical protein